MRTVVSADAETCGICSTPIGQLNGDGNIEGLAILPCGHTFGNECIIQWIGCDEQFWMKGQQDTRSCPYCRRRLVYEHCGHTIMPKELPFLIWGKKPGEMREIPVEIIKNEKDTPPKCSPCTQQDLPFNRDFISLARDTYLLNKLYIWTGAQCLPDEVRAGREIVCDILDDWKEKLVFGRELVENECRAYVRKRGPEKW
jgi:Ring finger domain